MIISDANKEMFYEEILSIIDQLGEDVILRKRSGDNDYKDYEIRTVNYNISTNTTKALNADFETPGEIVETGYTFIINYRELGLIPGEKDLILIPHKSTYGITYPLKIRDAFNVGETVPIVIDNMLLFLYLSCSRAEINTWS